MVERFVPGVDASAGAAYLETDKPQNVVFYRRFGFEVTAERTVLGVRTWFIWRGAQGWVTTSSQSRRVLRRGS